MCTSKNSAVTSITGISYLVACKGLLYKGLDKVPRKDALARIVRAALISKNGATRKVHLLFEDQCIITFTHEFLSSWGRGKPRDFHQDRFVELVGRMLAPAQKKSPRPQGCSIAFQALSGSLVEQLYPVISEATGGVYALEEEGIPLFQGILTNGESFASSDLGPVLFTIGGVRDVALSEAEAVKEICKLQKIQYSTVSLGKRAELTSKCIKVVEALDSVGRLVNLRHAVSTVTAVGEKICRSQKPTQDLKEDTQPFHVVIEVDAIQWTPTLAVCIADVFFRSGKRCSGASLSLFDSSSKVLTIRWRHVDEPRYLYERKVLSENFEETTKEIFQTALAEGLQTCSLDDLINQERCFLRFPKHGRQSRELLVLSAVSTLDVLDCPPHHEAAFEDTMCENSDAVMVIFSDKKVQGATVQGSLGSDIAVALAWASILHGEGFLAPAIRAKRNEDAKPAMQTAFIKNEADIKKTDAVARGDAKAEEKGAAKKAVLPKAAPVKRRKMYCSPGRLLRALRAKRATEGDSSGSDSDSSGEDSESPKCPREGGLSQMQQMKASLHTQADAQNGKLAEMVWKNEPRIKVNFADVVEMQKKELADQIDVVRPQQQKVMGGA
jgi:hypothetical protein